MKSANKFEIKKPFKETELGKAIRTGYQSLVAVLPIIYVVLTVPEVSHAAGGEIQWSVAIIPVLAALASYLQNKLGK